MSGALELRPAVVGRLGGLSTHIICVWGSYIIVYTWQCGQRLLMTTSSVFPDHCTCVYVCVCLNKCQAVLVMVAVPCLQATPAKA